jgi:ribosomal protein S18 acetylase RimI-like enzyme
MTIEHRLINSQELEQVFDLWVEVYPDTERGNWKREFLSIPGSQEHTYVAVDNGRVLSSALLWIREMNDSAGIVRRVGNVSHIATHPEARRQGHAKRLLALVIAQMERENCDFSTLFTSPEAQPLYEKFSWRTCPIPFWEGRLTGADLPQSTAYAIGSSHQFEESHLWQALADIYEEFNKVRPFAIQRDRSTWNSFTAYKIRDWVQAGALVWLAYPIQSPEEICGYLIAHRSDHGFLIAEIGVKEQHRGAIPNLLYQVVGSYEEGQRVGGRFYLPREPDLMPLLHRCFNPLVQIESTELMVRPVNPKKDPSSFFGPPSQGAGMFWILDQI